MLPIAIVTAIASSTISLFLSHSASHHQDRTRFIQLPRGSKQAPSLAFVCFHPLFRGFDSNTMYSWILRLNTVLTLSVTVLAALCAVASMTDNLHRPTPSVELEVLSVGPLERLRNGDDKVSLLLSIKADLESVFTWNTKQLFVFVAAEYWNPEEGGFNQISLWDTIIEKKENAKINQQVRTKLLRKATRVGYFTYPFQGKDLKGREFNLTMYWNVMPITGVFITDKVVIPGFQLPNSYN